jgi:hypothetical protein
MHRWNDVCSERFCPDKKKVYIKNHYNPKPYKKISWCKMPSPYSSFISPFKETSTNDIKAPNRRLLYYPALKFLSFPSQKIRYLIFRNEIS